MINWKYYFPFLFLIIGVSAFIHFSWLPNYIDNEHDEVLKQEQEYLSLLGITLLPSLISGDLAEVKGNLDQVLKSSHGLKSIELYSQNNVRMYPITSSTDKSSPQVTKVTFVISQDGYEYGRLIASIDMAAIIQQKVANIYKLEILLIGVLLIFVVISIYLQHRWVGKPVQELMIATSDVARGNYDKKLPRNVSGDMLEFVTSFDQMRTILKSRSDKIARQQDVEHAVQEVQSFFVGSQSTNKVFNSVLAMVLDMTKSKFGFIGEIEYDEKKQPFLRTFALTNIAWDVESRLLFEKSIDDSITFTNTQSLFGRVMVNGQPYISLDPENDEYSAGIPPGHPPLNSFFGIPLYNRQMKLVGMVGVANGSEDYSDDLYEELNILWLAIGNLIDAHREQAALTNSEQNLRAVVDNAVEGIITIDCHGIVQTFNPAAESMFGYNANEVVSKNIKMLMPDEFSKHHDQFLSTYLGGGKPKVIGVGRDVIGLRKNGETFPMELSVAEVRSGSERSFTGIVRDITERKQKEKELIQAREELSEANTKLEEKARTDGLTRISNRRHFDETLLSEFSRATRQRYTISLILLDIDHFKNYNDYYGHIEGDRCLTKVAQALQSLFQRSGEVVARYGGEEFAVILPHTDCEAATKMAEAIIDRVNNLSLEHAASKTADIVTVSVGVSSLYPLKGVPSTELVKKADEALYNAKANGRNQVVSLRIDPQLDD